MTIAQYEQETYDGDFRLFEISALIQDRTPRVVGPEEGN
jgi:hypothetical protein